MSRTDRELGLYRAITRRDFLNGLAVGAGASLVSAEAWSASMRQAIQGQPGAMDESYYPPAFQGLRGSHEGSFEVAHGLVDGREAGLGSDLGETYDLVVVGAGISGLAAAYFFQQHAGPRARILVLDNHDDFGGHAKRNEFVHQGRNFIGYGGTQSIDSPSSFSKETMGLLRDLNVDLERFHTAFDQELYSSLSLSRGVFFDEETFGVDRLVPNMGKPSWEAWAQKTPLSAPAQADLVRLYESTTDWLSGLEDAEKKRRLRSMSYLQFLEGLVKVHPDVARFMSSRTHGLFGMGIDGVPALDLWGLGYPGFAGMGLAEGAFPGMSATAIPHEVEEPYIFHFPDGNASVARLLVRKLIPSSADGDTMEDIVTARLRYGELDRARSSCRIRLNSVVTHVRQGAEASTGGAVHITYARGGNVERVRAERVILACYHSVIPYICPELPLSQRKALSYSPKVPLVYSNVLIRSWESFVSLGVGSIYFPHGYHVGVSLDFPVSLGTYRHPRRPESPIVLHLTKTPCSPGKSASEQHASGCRQLLATSFETFERQTRAQLARALGDGGFDPARDILGLTVNRWPHGYAYEYNSLWDPIFEPGSAPHELARKPHGSIHIANSDSAAYAYTQAAIDEAHRAVSEIIAAG